MTKTAEQLEYGLIAACIRVGSHSVASTEKVQFAQDSFGRKAVEFACDASGAVASKDTSILIVAIGLRYARRVTTGASKAGFP